MHLGPSLFAPTWEKCAFGPQTFGLRNIFAHAFGPISGQLALDPVKSIDDLVHMRLNIF